MSSGDGRVRVTIAELRKLAGASELNVDRKWWWALVNDAKVQGNDVRLCDSGLSWKLHVARGRVVAVTFWECGTEN